MQSACTHSAGRQTLFRHAGSYTLSFLLQVPETAQSAEEQVVALSAKRTVEMLRLAVDFMKLKRKG